MTKRDFRSTSVAMKVPLEPCTRSPSQCPGIARSSISAGLSRIETASTICILDIYLNIIEWGPDLRGLRPAARRYFGREPRELTPAEMAFLVAIDASFRLTPRVGREYRV
jgi:hypothetical protein